MTSMEVFSDVGMNLSQPSHHPLFSILRGTNYTCALCTEAFENEEELQKHADEHLAEEEKQPSYSLNHTCKLCLAPYKTKAGLKRHVKLVHSKRKRNLNVYTQNSFRNILPAPPADEENDQRENNLSFTCQLCAAPYKTEQGLIRHSETYHRNKTYTCDYCDSEFEGISILNDHINTAHSNNIGNMLDCFNQGNVSDGEGTTSLNYICPFCAAPYKTEQGFIRHAEIAHMNQMYSCDLCKVEFNGLLSLNDHITSEHSGTSTVISQTNERSKNTVFMYTCSTCTKSFANTLELLRHAITEHRKKPYICDECDEKFTGLSDLNDHIRAEHSFKTEISDGLEKQNQELPSSESDQTNYICAQCTEAFENKEELQKHAEEHLAKEEKQPLDSSTNANEPLNHTYNTNAPYRTRAALKRHVKEAHSKRQRDPNVPVQYPSSHFLMPSADEKWRVNLSFTCPLCAAPYKTKQGLIRHSKTCHRNKMYSCDYCDSEFEGISILNDHISAVHSDKVDFTRSESTFELLRNALTKHREKPYSCDDCGEKFTGLSVLNDHIRAEHSFQIKYDISDGFDQQNQELLSSESDESNILLKFVCPFCFAPYKTEQGLKHHIKIIHKSQSYTVKSDGNDLPFHCAYCGARFKGEQDLNVHAEKFHCIKNGPEAKKSRLAGKELSIEKYVNLKSQGFKAESLSKCFQCHICGAPFGYRGRLKNHLVKVHNQPEC